MEIILLEKVHNLGELGDSVRVARGYARNYLLPRKMAVRATAEAKAEVEARRAKLAAEESARMESLQARADLAVRRIRIERLANEDGKLYGSVAAADIAEAMSEAGARIDKAEVYLPGGVLEQTGIFQVDIALHPRIGFEVEVEVAAEGGDAAADSAGDAAAAGEAEDGVADAGDDADAGDAGDVAGDADDSAEAETDAVAETAAAEADDETDDAVAGDAGDVAGDAEKKPA